MSDGNAYAGNNETEPCPNGCGPLWPVTWEQEARNCWKALEEMHERLHPAPTPQADSQPAPVRDYPPLPDFETVEQHIYGACRRYITQDMLEPIHNLIRDVVDADRASRAPTSSVLEDAERLKEAAGLLEELAEHGSYSIEYDGQLIPICPECGEQEGDHRPDCAFARAKAFLAARKRGENHD